MGGEGGVGCRDKVGTEANHKHWRQTKANRINEFCKMKVGDKQDQKEEDIRCEDKCS